VYVNQFHTSETVFSVYFAVTSAFAAAGPLIYARLKNKNFRKIVWISHGVAAVAGGLLLTIGNLHPALFLLSFIPFPIMGTSLRTYMSELLLNAQEENIGAAAAAMNFGYTILGSLGMVVGSLPWSSYVSGLAYTIFIFAVIALSIFVTMSKLKVFQALKA